MKFARYFLFLWAAALPFVSFSGEKSSEAVDAVSRFTLSDLFGFLFILFSLPAGRLIKPNSVYPSASASLLLIIAVLSSSMAVVFGSSGISFFNGMSPVLIFGFLMFVSMRACALLRTEREILILASCIAVGGCVESAIVGHDLIARLLGGAMWFRDSMDLRARGTFRASGQLAQYGFVVGGVLFALSAWPHAVASRTRLWWTVTAVFLLMYPVFTTRRSGIASVAVLLAVWVGLGMLNDIKGVKRALPVLAFVGVLLVLYLGQAQYRSFLFGRVDSAQEKVASGGGFLSEQLYDAQDSIPRHPLFGVGWGLSNEVSRTGNEMHSSYLAALVDTGLAGFLAFSVFVGALLRLSWRFVKLMKGTPYLEVSTRLFALLAAQLVFWIHNRGLRDRGFFLFVAVLAGCAHHCRSVLRSDSAARA